MGDPSSPAGADASAPLVVVGDEQSEMAVDAARWARLASAVLHTVGAAGELTLTFVDRDEIAELNLAHLGEAGPTDVLSFPLDADGGPVFPGEPTLLGDVVVCPAVAADQAADHAGTLDDELALLVVHGCLHVLGYDHAGPEETAAMRSLELDLLIEHHWNGPPPDAFRQEHRS